MNVCSDHEETLLLDVHGELTPDERSAWERHLAVCDDCRQERTRLYALILKAKEGLSVPALSAAEEQALSGSIQRTLRMQKPDVRSARSRWWLAPAFAACMVLVVAGWFGLKNAGPDTAAITAKRVSEERSTGRNNGPVKNTDPALVARTSGRVSGVQATGRNTELPENTGPGTASIAPGRVSEEQSITRNEELLENMGLLQEMEELEQLVKLLDKQSRETSLRERKSDAHHVRALV